MDHLWSAWEVISGGLAGIFGVWVFGTVYYHNALEGGKLLLITNGLYANDWSTFGAFVVVPVAGLVFSFIVLASRLSLLKLYNSNGSADNLFHRSCNKMGEVTGATKSYHIIMYWDDKLIKRSISLPSMEERDSSPLIEVFPSNWADGVSSSIKKSLIYVATRSEDSIKNDSE